MAPGAPHTLHPGVGRVSLTGLAAQGRCASPPFALSSVCTESSWPGPWRGPGEVSLPSASRRVLWCGLPLEEPSIPC